MWVWVWVWVNADWKSERLAEFLPLLGNYDVLCLQEVFNTVNFRFSALVATLNKLGFQYVIAPTLRTCSNKLIDAGLVIASRFPILEAEYIEYEHSVYVEQVIQKGACHVVVQVRPDLRVHVFNTHIQADYTLHALPDVEAIKAHQARLVPPRASCPGPSMALASRQLTSCVSPVCWAHSSWNSRNLSTASAAPIRGRASLPVTLTFTMERHSRPVRRRLT